MLVSAGGQLIPPKEYIKHMWNLSYSQDIYEQIAVPLKHICDSNASSDVFPYIFFFNSLTEFIQNSSCDWPNKSCSILPMPVINQIFLPRTNLKFTFYKACIVVFRNHIEWAASPPPPPSQLNLVILKSTGSNLRRSVEGWGEFIENLKWIKIHWKYLAFLPCNKHPGLPQETYRPLSAELSSNNCNFP